MILSLSGIRKKVEDLAAIIQAPAYLLPTYAEWEEERPNIAQDANGQWQYQIYERGQLITNKHAGSEDDLLYFIFSDLSSSMALNYEFNNRNPRQDFRRVLFARQLELLGQLNEKWKEKKREEQQAVLKDNPYDDNSTLRLDYFDKLMRAGKRYEEAMSLANKKFPKKS